MCFLLVLLQLTVPNDINFIFCKIFSKVKVNILANNKYIINICGSNSKISLDHGTKKSDSIEFSYI